MLAGIFGAFLLAAMVFGLLGLISKEKRTDKEYVKDVKAIVNTGLQYFIIVPLLLALVFGSIVIYFIYDTGKMLHDSGVNFN